MEVKNTHGTMADGTQLPFYGAVQLEVRIKGLCLEEVFVVGRVSEDIILGMPFLSEHQCTMTFGVPIISIAGKQIRCTDRHGRQLSNDIQAVRGVTIEPRSEKVILARVTTQSYCPLGVVEGVSDRLPLAASLSAPNDKGRIWTRCMNPGREPLTLLPGETIGCYTAVHGEQVIEVVHNDTSLDCQERVSAVQQENAEEVPAHLEEMFELGKEQCRGASQRHRFARLLRTYSDVFSTREQDVGRTDLIKHSITVKLDTKPIRLPPPPTA